MALYFIAIPALNPLAAQAELNAFCAAHRVVRIERELVSSARDAYWAVCVAVQEGPGPLPVALKTAPRTVPETDRARVDYKALLSDAQFAVFASLRHWRKQIAEREAVPVYAVFTNQQLADIVRQRARCSR